MKSFFLIVKTELGPIDLTEEHLGFSVKKEISPKTSPFFNSLMGFVVSSSFIYLKHFVNI